MMLDEWVLTPMPSERHRSRHSLFVSPSSFASSCTRSFAAKIRSQPFRLLCRRGREATRPFILARSGSPLRTTSATRRPTRGPHRLATPGRTTWRDVRRRSTRTCGHNHAPRPGASRSRTSPGPPSATRTSSSDDVRRRQPMQVRVGPMRPPRCPRAPRRSRDRRPPLPPSSRVHRRLAELPRYRPPSSTASAVSRRSFLAGVVSVLGDRFDLDGLAGLLAPLLERDRRAAVGRLPPLLARTRRR